MPPPPPTVPAGIPHVFHRLPPTATPADAFAARLRALRSVVLPEIDATPAAADSSDDDGGGGGGGAGALRRRRRGTLVVVPSPYDFIALRRALLEAAAADPAATADAFDEYTRPGAVTRSRAAFFQRRVRVLVVPERWYWYWRSTLRGAGAVVWWGVPRIESFLGQVYGAGPGVGAAGAEAVRQVRVLYDDKEVAALGRVVGGGRARRMVAAGAKDRYTFA